MSFSLKLFLLGSLWTLRPHDCLQQGPFTAQDEAATRDDALEAALKFEIDFDALDAANKRHDHVVVFNVREYKRWKENISATVHKLGVKLGFPRPLDHVAHAYRSEVPVPYAPGKPRTIIIHMRNRTLKDAWAKAYCDKQLYRGNWYLYANLPRDVFSLGKETRRWAEKKGYAHVWHTTFDVYYRKRNDSSKRAFKVKDMEHLHYLHTNESYYEITEVPVDRNSTQYLASIQNETSTNY